MFRMTEINRTQTAVTLKLEGTVKEELFNEVVTACQQIITSGRKLLLDMADVSFVERRAILLLLELQNQQVDLINCSLFLSEQLKKAGDNYVGKIS